MNPVPVAVERSIKNVVDEILEIYYYVYNLWKTCVKRCKSYGKRVERDIKQD